MKLVIAGSRGLSPEESEPIRVAALAVAAIESLDRKGTDDDHFKRPGGRR